MFYSLFIFVRIRLTFLFQYFSKGGATSGQRRREAATNWGSRPSGGTVLAVGPDGER